tara:strand:- start:26 stop:205 length:180 start_codon:yes stop_codon:yes gene_type:complete
MLSPETDFAPPVDIFEIFEGLIGGETGRSLPAELAEFGDVDLLATTDWVTSLWGLLRID